MTAQTYRLPFEGYWREQNKGGIPAASGIYCVYVCTYNSGAGTVSLQKLVYIGESVNVRDRISGHEKLPRWRRHVGVGQELCFTYAPIARDRERAEAAMIYEHKPPENTEYVDSFPFDATTIETSGQNALLRSRFTVYPTAVGLRRASRW
jgi:hypothetical protein